jgi:hypothetical protein
MKKLDIYKIDWELVSEGLGLPLDKSIEMFNDGRILGRLGEFLHQEREKGERQNENSSFDIVEIDKIKTEVRSITTQVSFASSKEVGFGRKVTENGFLDKLNSVDRFVLIDKRLINDGLLETIEVTKEDILGLELGKNKSISADKFFKKYDRIK